MKITDYRLYKVKPRWLFLKLLTDEGFYGWGELISGAKTKTVEAALKEMFEKISGKDPSSIEDLWQLMYKSFYRGGPILMTVISGIEMALWDIKGHFLNVPVYELLGGKARQKIQVYSGVVEETDSDCAAAAVDRMRKGFRAIKLGPTNEYHYIDSYRKIERLVNRFAAIREAVGNDLEIAVDFHGRVHKGMSKLLIHELEPFHPMFIEEPLLPEHNELLKDLKLSTSIPIATGERLKTRWEFKHIITSGAVDIIQPDLSMTGGIFETRKICAMAEAFDIAVAPHAPYGPINLASTFQLDACTPNVVIQEQSTGYIKNLAGNLEDYVKNKEIFDFKDGYVDIPTGPGIGIEMNEEILEKKSLTDLGWSNPSLRNEDGTITNW